MEQIYMHTTQSRLIRRYDYSLAASSIILQRNQREKKKKKKKKKEVEAMAAGRHNRWDRNWIHQKQDITTELLHRSISVSAHDI